MKKEINIYVLKLDNNFVNNNFVLLENIKVSNLNQVGCFMSI